MRKPPTGHPGLFIRTSIIEPLGLSVTAAAKVLDVTRPALSALLNGHTSLTPEMALRVEKAFGVSMDTLLRLQTDYNIAETRQHDEDIKVTRYIPDIKSEIKTPCLTLERVKGQI